MVQQFPSPGICFLHVLAKSSQMEYQLTCFSLRVRLLEIQYQKANVLFWG